MITEKQFSQQVEDLLNIYGWRWCHFRPARTKHGWRTAMSGHEGFPDYVAVKEGRLLIFELKSERGKLSEAQAEWQSELMGVAFPILAWVKPIIITTWRPSDWDEIVETLGGD